MATLLILQHVPHERLGTFEDAFRDAGFKITPLDTYEKNITWPKIDSFDGLVVMGGPMSVYMQAEYPFLAKEIELLRTAIEAKRPILGVCLGAQLLAYALGASVTNATNNEIGWYPITREPSSNGDSLFEVFGETETVFQWHTDTYELPRGAVRLARSTLCDEQAFRYRDNVYGLQFHLEVTEAMVRAWMRTPVNKAQLRALRGVIDPMEIRRQSPKHIPRLLELSRHVAGEFSQLVLRT